MALDTADLQALVATASEILDVAAEPFLAGHRADSAVRKGGNDFATEVDLALERQITEALVSATGIGVHGEEFGGPRSIPRWSGCLTPSTGLSTMRRDRRWLPCCSDCCATANRSLG